MKSVSAGPRLPVLLTLVFLTSVSLFMFQVTVTRVFSPILQYHYVFLLTSLAIFGLGVGGIVAYRWSRPRSLEELLAALPGLLLLLAALFILAFSLIYKLPFLRAYWIYAAIASSPFVAGGVVISLIFRAIPQASHGLYFADLLGAGLGGAAVVLVLNRAGVVNAVLILSGLAVLGSALLLLARRQNTAVLPLAVAGVLAALGSYQVGIREFERRFTGYFTSPLTSLRRLRDSNLPHRLVDWSWDSYARTDLIEVSGGSGAFAGWIVSLDGGSNSEMIPLGPELDSVSALRGDLNYLPFVAGGSDRTLLIGTGAGKDIVLALLAGSREIHAVEVSAGTVRMSRTHGALNGHIYDRPEVTWHIQDGRNFVQRSGDAYDIIYLAQVMTEVAEIAGYAMAENFIYTTEAIRDYWNALTEQGRLAFVLHTQTDMSRLLNTIGESLRRIAISSEELKGRLVVAQRPPRGGHQGGEGGMMPVVLVKKTPLTAQERVQIQAWVEGSPYQLLYLPGGDHEGFWSSLSRAGQAPGVDLSPVTDNRPYFFDFRTGVEPTLLVLLAASVLAALSVFGRSLRKGGLRGWGWYFSGLGAGFMLIEIPLVQMLSLFLGHPIRSFITTVATLLLGGGLGSLAGKWPALRRKTRYLPLAAIPVLTVVVYALTARLSSGGLIEPVGLRILAAAALLLPLGFFMGMPFPFGMTSLKTAGQEGKVPLVWGLNGIMSIAGSVLAVILSMKIGFSYSLGAGALIYLVLFWLMPQYGSKWRVPG